MKAAEAKTSATIARQSTPFFKKGESQSFFGHDSADTSFFSKPSANTFIQPKLSIGRPGDQYEQEADAMADQVVQRLSQPEALQTKSAEKNTSGIPAIQPKCADCEQEEKLQKKEELRGEEEQLQRKPIFESNAPPPEEDIQRKCAACEQEDKLQRKGENRAAQTASTSIERGLAASRGSGSPLPETTRRQMEGAFGADFSSVRIHTGSKAVQLSQELGAQAFTYGSDVYFNKGKYTPGAANSQQLLAHELTHVVQQSGEGMKPKGLSKLSENYIHKQGVCEAPAETATYDEEQGVCEAQEAYIPDVDEVNNYKSIPFYTIAKVLPASGIRLHTTPSTQDPDYQHKTGRASDHYIQPKGSYVTILGVGIHPHVGWVKIKIQTGLTGWIEKRFLHSLIPLPATDDARIEKTRPAMDQFTRKLHYIEPGDKLETLINTYYKDYPYETGNDRRTIAHAFSILNEENPGVGLTGSYDDSFWKDTVLDRDFSETRKIYQTIQLYHGFWVRFPSVYYINLQRALGAVGVRPEWKNTTIAIGRGVQGFFEGVVAGFAQAAVDMVVDIWELVKGIFTGELFKKGYQLVKQFIELYQKEGIGGIWRVISGFFKGIYKSFTDKWNTPNPRQRWKFIGEIVGMILFEVVLAIFTAGVGTALKWSGRLAKVLRKFPALDNIVRSGAKNVEKLKAGKGKAVETARDLRDKKRLGFSDKEWETFLAGKNKRWDEVKGNPELLRLEMDALQKNQPRLSLESGYDVEIELQNNHIWRRKKDGNGWCRFSEKDCLSSEEINHLNLSIVENKSARLAKTLDVPEPEFIKEIVINGRSIKIYRMHTNPVVNMNFIKQGFLLDVSSYTLPLSKKFPDRSLNPDFIPNEIRGKGNKMVPNSQNLSNRQLADQGKSPYLANGEPVELHHVDQNFFGNIEEQSVGFHKSVGEDLDFHPMADDPAYISWRHEYSFFRGKQMKLDDIYNTLRKEYWKSRW